MTLERSKFAFNQYAIIVEDGNDSGSSYQLAPMFSVLTGVHASLTKMKGELNSRSPSQWVEFDIYLKRSMQASNRLVGTMVSGCWPGFNPGKGTAFVRGSAQLVRIAAQRRGRKQNESPEALENGPRRHRYVAC